MISSSTKDIIIVSSYILGIIGALYTFFKWAWPRIIPHIVNQWYYYDTGVHVIRDIEQTFGKSAGRVIREIINNRAQEMAIDEMRLNIIENAVGLGIYICNVDGECTYANKTLAKMFGLSQEEMKGYSWIGPIVDKQTAYANWKFAVSNGIPYRDTYEVKVNGEIFKYHTEAEPSMDENEKIKLGYVGIVRPAG